MARFTRLFVGACVVIVALALLAAAATALRSLQGSSPGGTSGTGSNVSFEDESGFLRAVCAGATLNGNVNERIAKSVGASVGSLTRGETTGCRAFGLFAATITVEAEGARPFPITYNSISGTLPNITGHLVSIVIRLSVIAMGRTCRYEGRVGLLFPATREARGSLTFEAGDFLPVPKATIQAGSTAECPREASLRGRLRLERTRILVLV
jgi:hypothetical protein